MPQHLSGHALRRRPEDGAAADIGSILAFLERTLPSATRRDAAYVAQCLCAAAARYDRHNERRDDVLGYAKRRQCLRQIEQQALSLADGISDLDILSRDDLATAMGVDEIEGLIGKLVILAKEAAGLAEEIQQEQGRPRDIVEERWILAVADIYENAFGRPARVWGSGDGSTKRRGRFYELLELSRPSTFLQSGKLSPRQVERVIERREKSAATLKF